MEWLRFSPLKVARFHSEHERPSGRKVCQPFQSAMGNGAVFPMKIAVFHSEEWLMHVERRMANAGCDIAKRSVRHAHEVLVAGLLATIIAACSPANPRSFRALRDAAAWTAATRTRWDSPLDQRGKGGPSRGRSSS